MLIGMLIIIERNNKLLILSLLSWIGVLLWMGLIFYLSDQPANESNQLSKGVTEVIIEKVGEFSPEMDFNNSSINRTVRKNAHFYVYLVLAMLMMNALNNRKLYTYKRIILTLIFCILYAITDEIHQLFVPGRGAQAMDVLIDSVGVTFGIGIYLLISSIIKKIKSR